MQDERTFDSWNIQKQAIHSSQNIVQFKERDVFFIRMGKNVGYEQDGKGEKFKRPVIVLKKFNKNIFLGVPLTSQDKNGDYYVSFNMNRKKQIAIISQIRLFSVKRISHKLGTMSDNDFVLLKQKIRDMI